MANNIKVLIGEINGVEVNEYEEHTLLADEVPFDNSSNGFTANQSQLAIEEAKQTGIIAQELPRFPASSIHNASLSNGQLVGISNLVNNPIVVPIKSTLAEVTYYQAGSSNKDAQFRFYKGAESAPNLFFTWSLPNTITNVAEGFGIDFTSPTFNQGDLLRVYFDDIGANPSDVSMVYYFQAVE